MGRLDTDWLPWQVSLVVHSTYVFYMAQSPIVLSTKFLAPGFLHSLGRKQKSVWFRL